VLTLPDASSSSSTAVMSASLSSLFHPSSGIGMSSMIVLLLSTAMLVRWTVRCFTTVFRLRYSSAGEGRPDFEDSKTTFRAVCTRRIGIRVLRNKEPIMSEPYIPSSVPGCSVSETRVPSSRRNHDK